MRTKEDVIRLTNEVFENNFEISPDRLKPEAHVFNDLGLDSLDTVDLVVALQKKFGVTIRDDERVRSIRTLADVYNFIFLLGEEGNAKGAKGA
ncbi:MAG: acyl carrier protein [Candidatus Omnitrophota bacterium]